MRRTLIVILTLLAARPAAAQLAGTVTRSKTSGFQASAGAQYAAIQFATGTGQTSGWRGGYGAMATVGYGFNSMFTAVLTGATAMLQIDGEDVPLQQIDLGMRVNMAGSNWRWVPFLEIGVGPRKMTQEDFTACGGGTCQQGDLVRRGTVWAQTLGVSFYPVRRFAITTAFQWNEGAMDDVTFNGIESLAFQFSARSTRLSLGGTWILSGGGR